jgi:endonuclease-3
MGKELKQLRELEKLAEDKRLAADGWKEDWECLIAILMSARTLDKTTIPVAEKLFEKYSLKEIADLSEAKLGKEIRRVNFYKGKTKRIKELAKILISEYKGKVPHDLDKLIDLPGIGRKTANVFLAEKGQKTIGVDTHVDYISHYLGWTNGKTQKEVEEDLEKLFPKRLWGKLNWVLVRFGQTYTSRKEKNRILDGIKKIS